MQVCYKPIVLLFWIFLVFSVTSSLSVEIFPSVRKNSRATPTPRNSENQILIIINSKKWPESPQKHQKIKKSIMLK